jgi:hypothetical protein
MTSVVSVTVWVLFIGYCFAWLIVAIASNPTWWWFVPVYGEYKIFQQSVWWGVFCVGILPAMFVVGLFAGET